MNEQELKKPFMPRAECFEKFGSEWLNPSRCSHLEEEGFNFKQCIKCGRVVKEKEGRRYFYRPNGYRYLITNLNKTGGKKWKQQITGQRSAENILKQ